MRIKKILSVLLVTLTIMLVGCGNKTTATNSENYKDVPTADIEAAVATAIGENYFPTVEIDAQYLEENFGVKSDMYTEFYGKIPMISVNVDTFIVIKAKDGQADAVMNCINERMTYLKDISMQYPMNISKIENSRAFKAGNYVAFIQLGGDAAFSAANEEEEVKAVIAENQKAQEAMISAIK